MTIGSDLRELEVPEHRPGFFDELRDELNPRDSRRPRLRLLLVAAAATVVAGVLAFSLTRGSEVASAAQVRAAVERAFASTGSISGVLVDHATPHPFILSSTGAFRIAGGGEDGTAVSVGDPARNMVTVSEGTPAFIQRITGLAGPPDFGPVSFDRLLGLGSIVATLADAHDSTVENVTYDERPAWLLRASNGNPGEQEVVTVDRASGMPVRDVVLRDGHLVSEVHIDHLRVSATVPRINPIVPARGRKVHVVDFGFRRMSLAAASHAAGYSPLVPKRLPHGFTLTGILVASRPRRMSGQVGAGNPPSRDVISLSYRRGFDEIIVTTRRTGLDPSVWTDPFHISGVATGTPDRVTFTAGALAGQSGYALVALDEIPHVWTAGPMLVVTVAGTVSRDDLLEVANSLTAR